MTFQRETKISLFFLLPRLSLSLTNFFFFLLAAVEKKDRPASSKIKKEPPFFVSEKVTSSFEIFALLSLCRRTRLKRTKRTE